MLAAGVCADCGATGQDGSFCARCGAVLNWTRPHAVVRPAPAGPPRAEPETAKPKPAEPEAETAEPEEKATSPDAAHERVRRLLVPVTAARLDESAPASDPAPVLPGRPEPARPRVRTGGPKASGGPPCPWCDTPNPPDRHFCRQCAMPLAAADRDGPRTRTWWQRLLRGDRHREVPWAGERPRLRRGPGDLLLTAALIASGVALVGTAAVKADDAAHAVVDHFVKRAPVPANGAKASHSDPKHGPGLAVDRLRNTFWGTGYGGGSQGVFLETSFSQPRRLLNVIITPGMSTQPDLYATQARPQILDATVYSSDGKSKTTKLQLDDAPGPQKLKLRGENVVRVRLTIRSAYGTASNRQVCVAEVEYFTRSTLKTL